jgi:hypothetical protein
LVVGGLSKVGDEESPGSSGVRVVVSDVADGDGVSWWVTDA